MSKVVIAGDASGTGTFTISAPNGNTDRTLVLPDEAGTVLTSVSSLAAANLTGSLPAIDGSALTGIQSATLSSTQSTNSGTSVDFTGIPSGTNQIIVLFNNNTCTDGLFAVQIGDSGGIETSGYMAWMKNMGGASFTTIGSASSTYFHASANISTNANNGSYRLNRVDSTTWVWSGSSTSTNDNTSVCAGRKELSGELDRIRILVPSGSMTAGLVAIYYQ